MGGRECRRGYRHPLQRTPLKGQKKGPNGLRSRKQDGALDQAGAGQGVGRGGVTRSRGAIRKCWGASALIIYQLV